MARKKKNDEVIIKPLFSSNGVKRIHPAMDFQDKAYITVLLPAMINDVISVANFIVTSSKKIIPLLPRDLKEHNLSLKTRPTLIINRWQPEDVKEWLNSKVEVDKKRLYKDIHEVIDYYMDFKNDYESAIAAIYVMTTYVYELFTTMGLFYINGAKRVGKTKLCNIFYALCFNGQMTSDPSDSSTFRIVDDNRGTLILDEMEHISNKNKRVLISTLLGGFMKGTSSIRNVKVNGVIKPKLFNPYGPKVISNIYGLLDTIEDRCIVVILQRTLDKAKKKHMPNLSDDVWRDLRNRLYRFLMDWWQDIKVISDGLSVKEIDGREWDIWKPLLSVAKCIGDDVYETVLKGAVEKISEKRIEDVTDTIETNVLRTLSAMVIEDKYYKVREITARVKETYNYDWINSRSVGKTLKRIGAYVHKVNRAGIQIRTNPSLIYDLCKRYGVEADDNRLVNATGSEHFGKCSQCEKDNAWLTHVYCLGTDDERFVCEDCGKKKEEKKLVVETSLLSDNEKVLNLIQGEVKLSDLMNLCDKVGVDWVKAEKVLEKLKVEGIIMEPRTGIIRRVEL